MTQLVKLTSQKLLIYSSKKFQDHLTIAQSCYVIETKYFPKFHEILCISIN